MRRRRAVAHRIYIYIIDIDNDRLHRVDVYEEKMHGICTWVSRMRMRANVQNADAESCSAAMW